jgi:hypothetical protein
MVGVRAARVSVWGIFYREREELGPVLVTELL